MLDTTEVLNALIANCCSDTEPDEHGFLEYTVGLCCAEITITARRVDRDTDGEEPKYEIRSANFVGNGHSII